MPQAFVGLDEPGIAYAKQVPNKIYLVISNYGIGWGGGHFFLHGTAFSGAIFGTIYSGARKREQCLQRTLIFDKAKHASTESSERLSHIIAFLICFVTGICGVRP